MLAHAAIGGLGGLTGLTISGRALAEAATPPGSAAGPLRAICDVPARRRLLGKPAALAVCPAPIPPQRDIQPESFYIDRSYSVVDPEKLKRYQAQTKNLSDFVVQVAKLSDAWLRSEPPQPAPAACALDRLDTWASAEAMLGHLDQNGEHQRKWILSGIALAYLKIRDAPGLDPAARLRVEQWFVRLARASLDFYATYARVNYNNHMWWAGLAAAAAGVAGNDRAVFDRAVALYRTALHDIQPDGTLPIEMFRKARALIYHINSLTPLVMLAEFGAANGLDLYTEKDGRSVLVRGAYRHTAGLG
jgi:poly(beta-D-mannuronate) lyase